MAIKTHGWEQMSGPPPIQAPALSSVNHQLFPRRASWVGDAQGGKDTAFLCNDHLGQFFYCKADQNGRSVRATELIATRLANRLGIRTAEWAVIEHGGHTYFGSQQETSSASMFEVRDFLSRRHQNELGQPSTFPGEYLAQVLAFDLFIGNPDRGANNFLLVRDGAISRICAIDFADSRLADLTTDRFPVAHSTTLNIGRRYQSIHGSHQAAAIDMVDQIEALPAAFFSRIVSEVPHGWLSEAEIGGLSESWGSPGFKTRLAALRSALTDGTLV